MSDAEAIARALAPTVAGHVSRAFGELDARLKVLEARSPEKGEKGEPGERGADGKDAVEVSAEVVAEVLRHDVNAVMGRVIAETVNERVAEFVAAWFEANPPASGKNGADGRDGVDGTNGKDGADAIGVRDARIDGDTLVLVMSDDTERRVGRVVGADGRDGSDGKNGADGKDGRGIGDALIASDGELVLTFDDGTVRRAGRVAGRDGTNGVDGQDGRDGLSVEDLVREYDAANHEIVETWTCAGRTKTLRYPAGGIQPGGHWRDGTRSVAGSVWVLDGSSWIALRDTKERPAASSDAWLLFARRGRDGERGQKGAAAEPTTVKLA